MKNWEKQLRPFAEQLSGITQKVHAMPTKELRALLKATNMPTATNCWWATAQAARFIRPDIEMELLLRKQGK